MTNGKYILDACCGSKMFWFDKSNPNILFADIRSEDHVLCDGRSMSISPDLPTENTSTQLIRLQPILPQIMIRFIDLKDQILKDQNEFAFYDTVSDRFMEFAGSQTWETVSDFKIDYRDDEYAKGDIERFLVLIPDRWKQG